MKRILILITAAIACANANAKGILIQSNELPGTHVQHSKTTKERHSNKNEIQLTTLKRETKEADPKPVNQIIVNRVIKEKEQQTLPPHQSQ